MPVRNYVSDRRQLKHHKFSIFTEVQVLTVVEHNASLSEIPQLSSRNTSLDLDFDEILNINNGITVIFMYFNTVSD